MKTPAKTFTLGQSPSYTPERVRCRTEGDINTTPGRQNRQARVDQGTREILDQDARFFFHQSLSTPCLDVVEGASGSFLNCRSAGRVLDFHGNNVHQVGHAHPHVTAAVKDQLDRLVFCPRRFTCRPAIELARELVRRSPIPQSKILLAPGGAEAMGMAMKIARHATGRYKTISFWDSFHGAALDTSSIGGERLFRDGMHPLLPGCLHAPPPAVPPSHRETPSLEAMRDPDYLGYLMRKEGDIGAVIAEPFRYSFALDPPADYWQRVRRLCDKHGALLVFDEIPVCLGRTGHWFACDRYQVVPDILVIGKGLGGGLFPLAAVLARSGLDTARDLALGHYTHEKTPLGSAAALAVLEVIETEGLLGKALDKGDHALAALERLRLKYPMIGSVSGIGLQLALELVDRHGLPAGETAEQVLYHCLSLGLSFKVAGGNILSLAPPLTIADEDLNRALEILDLALGRECETR